jgi:hypothetical protein
MGNFKTIYATKKTTTMNDWINVFTAKWIEFVDVTPGASKTMRFMVINKQNHNALGEIKWYSAFRKYSFFPLYDTVYESQCLSDITRFLNQLMEERKLQNFTHEKEISKI